MLPDGLDISIGMPTRMKREQKDTIKEAYSLYSTSLFPCRREK